MRRHRERTGGGPRRPLLPREEMLTALRERDRSYDGLFYAAVTTTGVFCRPSCPARDPKPEHVEFYATTREALVAGFRPCKRCRPLDAEAGTPEWASRLIARVEADPSARISDADLRAEGLDPAAVRRWFRKTHGMTFQAYCRARRLGDAFVALRSGGAIDEVVFDHGWGSHSGFRTAFGKLAGAPPGEAAAAPDGSLIRLTWLETPVGPLVAGATDDAVCLLEYPDRRMMESAARDAPAAVRPAARARRQPALRAAARAAGRVLRRPAHAPSTSRSSTPGAPSSAASGTPCGASPTARRAPTRSSPARSARRARRAPWAPPTAPTASPSSSPATA